MTYIEDLDRKRDLIQEHEELFSRRLAARVVDVPEVHVWMILIPIIFVLHFFRLNQAKEAKKQFAEGYMISRRQALDAVWEAMRANPPAKPSARKKPTEETLDKLCEMSAVPKKALPKYRPFIEMLAEHYADLLSAKGGTYEDLVRRAYSSRTNYLLFVNQLNNAERAFNKAIRPHLPEEVESAQDVVASMEKSMVEIRKEQARSIFA